RLDLDFIHLAVNRDLEFQSRSLWRTYHACDAWIVSRPCWAQPAEPSKRICRMGAFFPRKAAMAALMTSTSSSLRPSASGKGGNETEDAPFSLSPCLLVSLSASSAVTRSLSRATSRRSASSVSARRARSTVSCFMTPSVLQRDQAVLLRWPALALGL